MSIPERCGINTLPAFYASIPEIWNWRTLEHRAKDEGNYGAINGALNDVASYSEGACGKEIEIESDER
jgi:hypothetical protein